MQPQCVLTIAGSDSGGGAGIQADLRTFAAHGVHGASAISAVTAQNTLGVYAICALEPEMVAAQVQAVIDDLPIVAVKTGMLARPATIERVAKMASDGWLPNLVVDPVLVSSTGHALMEEGGARAYRDSLLSFATIATPNLGEAAVLCDVDIEDIKNVEDMSELARRLLQYGPRYVLLKGGHPVAEDQSRAPDVLASHDGTVVLESSRVATSNDHGTGCSLASAIACGLAQGLDVEASVSKAKKFVHAALASAAQWHLGAGHGPIDHFGWSR